MKSPLPRKRIITCAVPNCGKNRENYRDLRFHRFPKESERCKKWLMNIGRTDLLGRLPEQLFCSHLICGDHFEECQYSTPKKKYLVRSAVPTVFNSVEQVSPLLKTPTSKQRKARVPEQDINDLENAHVDVANIPLDGIHIADMVDDEIKDEVEIKEEELPLTPQKPVKLELIDAVGESDSFVRSELKKSSEINNTYDKNNYSVAGPTSEHCTSPLSSVLFPIVRLEELPPSVTLSLDQGERRNKPKKKSEVRGIESCDADAEMKDKESNNAVVIEGNGSRNAGRDTKVEEVEFKNIDVKKRRSRGRKRKSQVKIIESCDADTEMKDKESTDAIVIEGSDSCNAGRATKVEGEPENVEHEVDVKNRRRSRGIVPFKYDDYVYEIPGSVKRTKRDDTMLPLDEEVTDASLHIAKKTMKEEEPEYEEFTNEVPCNVVIKEEKKDVDFEVKETIADRTRLRKRKTCSLESAKVDSKMVNIEEEPRDLDQAFVTDNVSYVMMRNGTQRGGRRLIGGDGFTYNLKKTVGSGRVDWRCSFRPRFGENCRVAVRQYKSTGTYKRKGNHLHEANPTAFISSLVTSEMKKRAKANFLKKPREIVDEILKENAELINQSGCEFNIDCLIRSVNRGRATMRKVNPMLQQVKVNEPIPDNFFCADVIFKARRHLVFATKKQLQLLSRADQWFIDITRKFVAKPFLYLLTISAYIHTEDDKVKLKPLAFVLMSSILMKDFEKAFRGLLKHLRKPLSVRSFVLDYYEGLWYAVRALFFNCKIYGCAWKFGQCVWANIQKLGLKDEQVEMYDQIHKLLKLPFMAPKDIRETFEILKEEFMSDAEFESLIEYMENTWLYSSLWRVTNWSVYKKTFRTKADVIGWHYGVHIGGKSSSVPNVIKELFKIANTISESAKPASQMNVRRYYMENTSSPQGKVFQLWAESPSMPKSVFLSQCCQLSEPVMDGMVERMIQEYRMQMKEYS